MWRAVEGQRPAHPYRDQIVDIPPLSAKGIEHQLHQLECTCCGRKNRAPLPAEVPSLGLGDRLAAVVARFSVEHRQSHRMVPELNIINSVAENIRFKPNIFRY
ncbi:hypothetical protein [Moorena sp. SIO2C4]|uniref:hypothetical protein n=1 Tax=Moorena sp. SIO2C4 TaxID=2607824 RepID=UPI0013C5B925|nr:hypothetical protein [Moorena sp. SIO2C4]NES42089.1 hypothetical protein [Moorena sp. SIO2C4]